MQYPYREFLLNDVAYWLSNDDSDNLRFQFLHYLVNGNLPKLRPVPVPDPDPVLLPLICFGPYCLSSKALQFCIDSCLYVFNNQSFLYFLEELQCFYFKKGKSLPLTVSCLSPYNFDFRYRKKFFANQIEGITFKQTCSFIDSYFQYSGFVDYFSFLLSRDISFSIKV